MVNCGPPAAEIVALVWGMPVNLKGFRVLASLLQRHRSPEAKQTLHDVWLLPLATTLYIHFLRLLLRNLILPGAKFTLCPRLALSYIGSVTARVVGVSQTLWH